MEEVSIIRDGYSGLSKAQTKEQRGNEVQHVDGFGVAPRVPDTSDRCSVSCKPKTKDVATHKTDIFTADCSLDTIQVPTRAPKAVRFIDDLLVMGLNDSALTAPVPVLLEKTAQCDTH